MRVVPVLAVLLGSSLLAQEGEKKLTDLQQAKARIVQLESQLAKVQADAAVCGARLTLISQQQNEQKSAEVMKTLEKEFGCPVDWQIVPPDCKKK